MKIIFLLALALVCWFAGRSFFGKLWLAFVSPLLSKFDAVATRAAGSPDVLKKSEQPLSSEQVEKIRANHKEEVL